MSCTLYRYSCEANQAAQSDFRCCLSGQDIDEIESLALALRKEIEATLQPFYMGHMCLYVTPECFDDPPKTPEVYNDATACVWRDGTWQLLEDTSEGFLLFVQSKSKEEAAA